VTSLHAEREDCWFRDTEVEHRWTITTTDQQVYHIRAWCDPADPSLVDWATACIGIPHDVARMLEDLALEQAPSMTGCPGGWLHITPYGAVLD
jgi:hypothetical protein